MAITKGGWQKTKSTNPDDWDQEIWDAQAKAQAEALKSAMTGTTSTSAGLYGGVLGGPVTPTSSLGLHPAPVNIFDMMERGMLYKYEGIMYIVQRGDTNAYFWSTNRWRASAHAAADMEEYGKPLGTVKNLLTKLADAVHDEEYVE